MKNNTQIEKLALEAAFKLHFDLSDPNDNSFCGYEGSKENFDRLYKELYVIARDEVSLEVDPIDQICETFHEYQTEICVGYRDADWYL